MSDSLRQSVSKLIEQIEALEPDKRTAVEQLATRNIDSLRIWLDLAQGWFQYPDEEEDSDGEDTEASDEEEITCPHCDKPIKVRLLK